MIQLRARRSTLSRPIVEGREFESGCERCGPILTDLEQRVDGSGVILVMRSSARSIRLPHSPIGWFGLTRGSVLCRQHRGMAPFANSGPVQRFRW